MADEFDGICLADQLVEPVAVSQPFSGRILDRLGERALAADLDQPAVAVRGPRPISELSTAAPCNESMQPLARVIPVDEEDDA